MSQQPKPQLAPPGAGLPFIEGLVARYVLYPASMFSFNWQASLQRLRAETDRIKALAAPLSEESLYTPVLIKRLAGIEDSSRYWSVGMTIEHLIITMKSMSFVASKLAQGEVPDIIANTANVKPSDDHRLLPETLLRDFEDMTAKTIVHLSPLAETANTTAKLAHPFFGPISAQGWVWTLGMHQGLHRRQVELIIAGLKSNP